RCSSASGSVFRTTFASSSGRSNDVERSIRPSCLTMEFNLSEVQQSFRARGESLGDELPADAPAADVVMGAARIGILDPAADLLSAALAVEGLAARSSAAAIALALHTGVMLSLGRDDRFTAIA